jgi:signal transduction histidine kinase
MHPLLSDSRALFAYMLAWLAAGLAAAWSLCFAGLADWPGALLFALPQSLVFGFAALSGYYVCRAMPHAGRRLSGVAMRFGVAALLAGGGSLAIGLVWNDIGQFLLPGTVLVHLDSTARLQWFALCALLYLLSLLAHDVHYAFEREREASACAAEMRALAREAELQMLRAQVDPHFLFNSLNSICALIGSDAEAAREMTIDLAEFFRRTLALAGCERIALGDELVLCEHYLAIERRRFGARLTVAIDVDDAARACLLPPLCLQPLLENAVKHGIRPLAAGGTVHVAALVRDGWLHLRVDNPLDAAAPPAPGTALGLANLRERLSRCYAGRARLLWRREDAAFTVEMTVPQHKDPA